MAGNPQWCLTLDEWHVEKFERWIDSGSPEALLHGSIFFDLRPLHGDFGAGAGAAAMAAATRVAQPALPASNGHQRAAQPAAAGRCCAISGLMPMEWSISSSTAPCLLSMPRAFTAWPTPSTQCNTTQRLGFSLETHAQHTPPRSRGMDCRLPAHSGPAAALPGGRAGAKSSGQATESRRRNAQRLLTARCCARPCGRPCNCRNALHWITRCKADGRGRRRWAVTTPCGRSNSRARNEY